MHRQPLFGEREEFERRLGIRRPVLQRAHLFENQIGASVALRIQRMVEAEQARADFAHELQTSGRVGVRHVTQQQRFHFLGCGAGREADVRADRCRDAVVEIGIGRRRDARGEGCRREFVIGEYGERAVDRENRIGRTGATRRTQQIGRETLAALPRIITGLKEQGYRLLPLWELMQARDPEP